MVELHTCYVVSRLGNKLKEHTPDEIKGKLQYFKEDFVGPF